MSKVMIVEDDATVRNVIFDYLGRRGHEVIVFSDGVSAWRAIRCEWPDVLVLDRMLPGMSGDEVCRKVRNVAPDLPIIMLTALGEARERIQGLETGADDYIPKPFALRELQLRVDSLLRRSQLSVQAALPSTLGPFRVDLMRRQVWVNDSELELAAREFDLFLFFLRNPDRVFSRTTLLREVWGWSSGEASTVTVHVRRLREKIEPDPTIPQYLLTKWGKGYEFTVNGVK